MPIIILRQSVGITEPLSANTSIKNYPLTDPEVDNNFNNLNNGLELSLGNAELAYVQANTVYDYSNTKFSSSGGVITGNVNVVGVLYSNNYIGTIDAGSF